MSLTNTSMFRFASAALFFMIIMPGCSPKYYESIKWQPAEVQADGSPAEWSIPLRHYDPISRLNYDFSNDRKNLYVIFRVSDPGAQVRLTHAGMEIALDSAGGKKFPVTMGYPLPSAAAPEEVPGSSDPDSKAGRKSLQKNVIATQDHILLNGFKNIPNGLAPITNDYGIKVGLNWDKDGTLYYEAVIPFKSFYKETLSAKDTLKPFSFRVTLDVLPGMENSELANDGSGSGGGGGHRSSGGGGMGGMGGGLGGTGGGGMNGGMTGSMPPPGAGRGADKGPQKSVIEFKMKLALK